MPNGTPSHRASSLLSNLAADLRPRLLLEIDIGERLSVVVAHDEAGGQFLDSPGQEAVSGHAAPRPLSHLP